MLDSYLANRENDFIEIEIERKKMEEKILKKRE